MDYEIDRVEPLTDQVEAVEDRPEGSYLDEKVGGAAGLVVSKYNHAKDCKRREEERALKAYRNYRGLWSPDMTFTKKEKSKVFVKVTKTKTLAAYGQLVEVLFGGHRFPISIEPQALPEGVSESVHIETNPQLQGNPEARAITEKTTSSEDSPYPEMTQGPKGFEISKVGPLREKLGAFADQIIEGPGSTPTSITFHPAMVAAKKMEKKMHDQLEQSHASKHLRSLALEMALYGTGIMKGPFAYDKEYPKWDETGMYVPEIKTVPRVEAVSFWNFYPDPDAARMDEAQWVVERHKMSRKDLRDLKKRPFFRANVIEDVIDCGENYQNEDWEYTLGDRENQLQVDRFEVLEFWGLVDAETLADEDIKIPKSLEGQDTLNVNIWVCGNKVLRLVLNPFQPSYIPYHVVPYEINPYSMFGIGVAENMEDSQILMNGFMRMAVDNAALSGNVIFEIDKANLEPGQDLELYPGKAFIRQEGAPGQALFATEIPNVAQQNMMLFDKARVLADESTGFPSYAHGQTDIQGVGRTASGISMLMDAANGGIRTVIKNVDDYLLAPLGKALFAFNMQFSFDPEIKGDLEVKARGTESLMANEVRSQRLMQFLNVVGGNPNLAPFAKLDVIVREIAKSLELDPDKVVNNMSDAMLQAEIMKKLNPPEQGVPGPAPGPQAPPGVGVNDPTGAGGGNIGTGQVPLPTEPGFSANGVGTGMGEG